MAKRTVVELFNHHIGVEHGRVVDPETTEKLRQIDPTAEEATSPFWVIVFTDRDTGDVIRVGLAEKGRDGLVRDLTGGIVLAGGELPRI